MAETEPYLFTPGTTPLLVSLPHASSFIPAALGRRMTDAALLAPDTDRHVARLYDFAASPASWHGCWRRSASQSRSQVPRFFDGALADLNFGTDNGRSAAGGLRTRAFSVLERSSYEAVLDGRFTGGFITRKHGNPAHSMHALQLELTWRNYMDEMPPFAWRPDKAEALQPVLRALLQELVCWAVLPQNER